MVDGYRIRIHELIRGLVHLSAQRDSGHFSRTFVRYWWTFGENVSVVIILNPYYPFRIVQTARKYVNKNFFFFFKYRFSFILSFASGIRIGLIRSWLYYYNVMNCIAYKLRENTVGMLICSDRYTNYVLLFIREFRPFHTSRCRVTYSIPSKEKYLCRIENGSTNYSNKINWTYNIVSDKITV